MLRISKRFTLFFFFSILFVELNAQTKDLTFAVLTDIHIGRASSVESTTSSVADINNNQEISFVLVTGDLTNNGADDQVTKAKELLDKLNKPYYVVPGNHENAWSPSGGQTFMQVFKNNRFQFEHSGYLFVGTDCGPMVRHGLAHVPTDNLLWLDSVFSMMKNKDQPVIFINHYPMTSAVDNEYEVIKRLKKQNVQLILCGHGHNNRKYNFSGIPGIMSRTNLPLKEQEGYNIVKIENGTASFRERLPGLNTLKPAWASVQLKVIPKDSILIKEPDYSVNSSYPNVRKKWEFAYKTDIQGGFTIEGNTLYTGTYDGQLIALDKNTGKQKWSFPAGGRIYATPAVSGNKVVFTSTNGHVYCISTGGKALWKFKSSNPIVASPLIKGDRVFTGFSNGSFSCLDLNSGKEIWTYTLDRKGFIQNATLYGNNLYFGAWNSNIYCLDQQTGKLKWKWSNDLAPAYSPAMVPPIATKGRIFTLTPDYFVTCFDAESGKIIWREKNEGAPVWFSNGLSRDSSTIFAKTRNDKAVGISTTAPGLKLSFSTPIPINNDSSPTVIPEMDGLAIISSNNGLLIAVSKETGKIVWQNRVSGSSINMVLPVSKSDVYVSTNDGKIVLLSTK